MPQSVKAALMANGLTPAVHVCDASRPRLERRHLHGLQQAIDECFAERRLFVRQSSVTLGELLAGQLDVQVYEAPTKDYKQISDNIMKIAYEWKLAHEISALHKALRFTNDAPSLSDYLRGADQ